MTKKYIVVFKDDTPKSEIDKAATDVENAGGKVTHRYDGGVLNGFAAEIPDTHFQKLESSLQSGGSGESYTSKIDYIEPDGVATIQ
ncbi:hypothetical protein FRC12_004006 [Ceratobasidium sp. 428]|nr:hypothetical protein FRC12_004006 [Ceratobasidium sp. 428]